MAARQKLQVLCVDDEPSIVEALCAVLADEYDAQCATSAAQALQKVNELERLAVVVSDMRMPGMDGASFLHEVMLRRPDVTRILLTGDSGRDLAVDAVNKGQIFRFLTKPAVVRDILHAVEAGVIQYRLVHAERAVLQETLIGCIRSLMEVLAIANPSAFGRAERIKRIAMECSARFACTDYWQLEAAALLSQVGYVALSPVVIEKLHDGATLTSEELQQVGGVPNIAHKLLAHIPRLEPVFQILDALTWPDNRLAAMHDGIVGLGAKILGAALEFEQQVAQGKSVDDAFEYLHDREVRYGENVVIALEKCLSTRWHTGESMEITLRNVRPGMMILEEARRQNGMLVIPRGAEVIKTFLQRIENIAPDPLDAKVRVRLSAAAAPGTTV